MVANACSIAAASPTSNANGVARPPAAAMRAICGARLAASRLLSSTCAPALAKPNAISAPSPRDAPVTSATRSRSENKGPRGGSGRGRFTDFRHERPAGEILGAAGEFQADLLDGVVAHLVE